MNPTLRNEAHRNLNQEVCPALPAVTDSIFLFCLLTQLISLVLLKLNISFRAGQRSPSAVLQLSHWHGEDLTRLHNFTKGIEAALQPNSRGAVHGG